MLAGIGLYGLLAYTVARRTNEIGIRMALGATASDVSRLVLGDALGMVCAGLVAGTAMVLWSRPLAASVLHDLKFESRGAIGDRRRGDGRGRAAGVVSSGAAGGSRGPDGGAAARVGNLLRLHRNHSGIRIRRNLRHVNGELIAALAESQTLLAGEQRRGLDSFPRSLHLELPRRRPIEDLQVDPFPLGRLAETFTRTPAR